MRLQIGPVKVIADEVDGRPDKRSVKPLLDSQGQYFLVIVDSVCQCHQESEQEAVRKESDCSSQCDSDATLRNLSTIEQPVCNCRKGIKDKGRSVEDAKNDKHRDHHIAVANR